MGTIRSRPKALCVCYVLSYYIPDYIRSRTLVAALTKIEHIRLYQARNSSKTFLRYFQTLGKLMSVRLRHDPELYILGFRGYELFWPVRLITLGKSLVLDHMMSPYDSLLNEHETIRKGGFLAKLVYLYEKSILHSSAIVLTDTRVHKEFLQDLFHLPPARVVAVPVGADEDVFHVSLPSQIPAGPFEVLFYGSFLPLHGVDVILKAASFLQEYPIHFTLIGGYKAKLSDFHRMVEQLNLRNMTHVSWVKLEHLPQRISQADIGLGGPFGNTGQARRVITAKTFQMLAMGKAVVVGETEEAFGFVDKKNCLLVPRGNPTALAEALSWAYHHRTELRQIGELGHQLYQDHYSIALISEKLRMALFREVR